MNGKAPVAGRICACPRLGHGAAGLAHRRGAFVFATHGAMRFDELRI
jgi:hypothetical protein